MKQIAEMELGPELSRYRRRPELDILRSAGLSAWFYYGGPIYAAMLSFFLSMPVIYLAGHMGATPPMWTHPAWGPVIIGWYCVCLLTLLWFMYGLPRRVFLAIHRDGFVFQGMLRRYSIRFRDIAKCQVISAPVDKILDPETLEELDKAEHKVISSPSTFRLIFVDGTQMSRKGLLGIFPQEAALQLLNEIELHKSGTLQVSDVDYVFKHRLRRLGLFLGLLMEAILVYTPVCDDNCRAVTRKAFGPRFCGLPCEISVPILVGLLFAPLVFFCPHLVIVLARRTGWYDKAEIRKAWRMVIVGGIYFLSLMAAWGVYTSIRGA